VMVPPFRTGCTGAHALEQLRWARSGVQRARFQTAPLIGPPSLAAAECHAVVPLHRLAALRSAPGAAVLGAAQV
jgi:hypothetical protein